MPESASVVVVGQLARDVVLLVDRVPDAGTAADVRVRREILGGKGANQAVALAQLGVPVALVAVSGDDKAADAILDQAHRDGIDVTHVVRRPGVTTGLIVEVLDAEGQWRYLQDLPPEVQLTVPEVEAAAEVLRHAAAVLVQLQQPGPAVLTAARLARDGGALVVLDGLLPHLSRANRSPRSRHAYTLHVVEAGARYPADNWLRRAHDFPPRGFE